MTYKEKQEEIERLYRSKINYRFPHVLKEAIKMIQDSGIKASEKQTIIVLLDLAEEHGSKANGILEKRMTLLKNKSTVD